MLMLTCFINVNVNMLYIIMLTCFNVVHLYKGNNHQPSDEKR